MWISVKMDFSCIQDVDTYVNYKENKVQDLIKVYCQNNNSREKVSECNLSYDWALD